jgi:hypothetical protein
LAVFGLVGETVTAQPPPNFSGRWTVGADKGATQPRGGVRAGGRGAATPDMGSGWGPEITVTQDADKLTVQTTHVGSRDMQSPLRFEYLLNGAESTNRVMVGRGTQEQVSKAAWDGAKLIITTVHRFKDPQNGAAMTSETKQALSLESPTSLVIETTHGPALGGQPVTTKTTYRKN